MEGWSRVSWKCDWLQYRPIQILRTLLTIRGYSRLRALALTVSVEPETETVGIIRSSLTSIYISLIEYFSECRNAESEGFRKFPNSRNTPIPRSHGTARPGPLGQRKIAAASVSGSTSRPADQQPTGPATTGAIHGCLQSPMAEKKRASRWRFVASLPLSASSRMI